MKFTLAFVALAATALAAPAEKRDGACAVPGEYFCNVGNGGIVICDTQGQFEVCDATIADSI